MQLVAYMTENTTVPDYLVSLGLPLCIPSVLCLTPFIMPLYPSMEPNLWYHTLFCGSQTDVFNDQTQTLPYCQSMHFPLLIFPWKYGLPLILLP